MKYLITILLFNFLAYGQVKEYGAIGDSFSHPLSQFFASLPDAKETYPFIGSLVYIGITNKGSGYSSVPLVSITGGGGSDATGQAQIDGGKVVTIKITNYGSGYTSIPSVSISGGGGSGATARCGEFPKDLTAEIDYCSIRKAIDELRNGGKLFLPQGSYQISSALPSPTNGNPFIISGEGMQVDNIKNNNKGTTLNAVIEDSISPVIYAFGYGIDGRGSLVIEDLTLTGGSGILDGKPKSNNHIGIYLSGNIYTDMNRVAIDGFDSLGVACQLSWHSVFRNGALRYNGIGAEYLRIENTEIQYNMTGVRNCSLSDWTVVEGNAHNGAEYTNEFPIHISGGFVISNTYFEANGLLADADDAHIYLDNVTVNMNNVSFGGYVDRGVATHNVYGKNSKIIVTGAGRNYGANPYQNWKFTENTTLVDNGVSSLMEQEEYQGLIQVCDTNLVYIRNGRTPMDTLTINSSTPSVFGFNGFRSQNTQATLITGFRDGLGISGQKKYIVFNDDSTTINFSNIANVRGNGAVDWTPKRLDAMIMTCFKESGQLYWYCTPIKRQ